jgi:hypothetical protein
VWNVEVLVLVVLLSSSVTRIAEVITGGLLFGAWLLSELLHPAKKKTKAIIVINTDVARNSIMVNSCLLSMRA